MGSFLFLGVEEGVGERGEIGNGSELHGNNWVFWYGQEREMGIECGTKRESGHYHAEELKLTQTLHLRNINDI